MNPSEIAALARAARKAGVTTMLQLEIAGHLLKRGECTLLSLSNSIGVSLEAISHAAAQLEINKGIKAITCREAVGFSMIDLTPTAAAAFSGTVPPLRSKNLARR